jgi:SAM-dependent methyltransferase
MDVSPLHFFDSVNSHIKTATLKSAIEVDLFTAIAEGNSEPASIAKRCKIAERGARILSDYLVINGFITKNGGKYELTPDSAVFLDRRSPGYMGGAIDFLLSPTLLSAFENLTEAVRKGGTALQDEGTVGHDNPVWVKFAQAMASLSAMPARIIAELVPTPKDREVKVLDIAAGHGLYGIAFAQQNPKVKVTALDWANVLEVAKGNAAAAGVGGQYNTLPGSAFDVDFGTGYDVVLLTNFLHHFDEKTNVGLLKKIHSALADGGRVVTLEFVPNDDRVTPPPAAGFSMVMLATTPRGDAYTFAQLDKLAKDAGFTHSEIHPVLEGMSSAVISYK